MSYTCCPQFYLIIALSSFSIIQTVPPNYCLSPLNQNDCNMKPTPVFSYYKPGSRCEIEMWRGCPTLNKFPNEYLCSFHCIFRMKYEEQTTVINECDAKLNSDQCTNTTMLVYTHINGVCVETLWRGCPSANKFEDKATCDKTCDTVVNETTFIEILDRLDQDSLEEINEVLKVIIEEELTTEAQTEAATEASSEEHESEPEPTTETATETTTNDEYDEVINP